MKTTLDLPDDLLIEAKAVAAKRRTTLKAMVEHALRREIGQSDSPEVDSPFEMNDLGFLVLKRRPGVTITTETIRNIQNEMDQEEFDRALKLAGKR